MLGSGLWELFLSKTLIPVLLIYTDAHKGALAASSSDRGWPRRSGSSSLGNPGSHPCSFPGQFKQKKLQSILSSGM